MDIQYFGANCVRITTKKSSIVVDDDLAKLGLKSIVKESDTALFSENTDKQQDIKAHLLINQPGEYEVSDVSIEGIPAKDYKETNGKFNRTIYKLEAEDIKIAILGNVSPDLTDLQLETLGKVNVLVIPVGGNDLTLNGNDALKVIKAIEPDIVIPTHYQDKLIKYEKPQLDLSEAINQLAMEPFEKTPKLKLKSNTVSEAEATKLIVLERS